MRESSRDARKSIYRRLLLNGVFLSLKSEGKATIDSVLSLLSQEFFGIQLERRFVEEYLDEMRREGIVVFLGDQMRLSPEMEKQIEDYGKKSTELIASHERQFIKKVSQKASRQLYIQEETDLRNCYYQFILRLVSRYVTTTAKFFIQGTLKKTSKVHGENIVNACTSEFARAIPVFG